MTEDQTILDDLCRRAAELIAAGPAPLKSVRLRAGDMSVEVEWPDAASFPGGPGGRALGALNGAGANPPGDAPPLEPAAAPDTGAPVANDSAFVVNAPLVGTFYRAPSPDARPFVEVGDEVEEGRQVAIVEAMKLMNAVTAERPGRVVEILVEDAAAVEYGQPLLVLGPLA